MNLNDTLPIPFVESPSLKMNPHAPHQARKRFGQNFLHDHKIIDDIVHAVRPTSDAHIVEIGPGLGALTTPLLQRVNHLHVIELDRDLIARLQHQWPPERLTVHAGDALQFDFSQLPTPLHIVGNLPYNISTPLLFHLAQYAHRVIDMHFMLQKEVVERMTASAGHAAYGRLSVMLQYRFDMEKLFDVPPQAFHPAPKVDSAVVRLIPWPTPPVELHDEALFQRLITDAFSQRRKTIRNTLRAWFDESVFSSLGISPSARPETLTLHDYAALANTAAQQNVT